MTTQQKKSICGICQRQVSRYTCPSCNLSYCSLKCFRSERHSRCSELFYRKEIETGIQSDASKTKGDKKKVVELLKKIEEQNAADEDGLFHLSAEEDEEESLADRFSAIDISSASNDDILRLLTEEEREKFFFALKNPSSELARELLESAELDNTRQLPWWEAHQDAQSSLSGCIPHGTQPTLMAVPTKLINPAALGVSLLYNICAVLLAYTYVTRHLTMSPLCSTIHDPQGRCEARKIISQSVPFLIDRKSRVLHTSLTEAVLSFWSRFNPGSIDNKTILALLEDVSKIVRPALITVAGHPREERECSGVLAADHPFTKIIMAISDISSLFRNYSHIEMKLTFYAAHILSTPSSRLRGLADELLFLSRSMGKEAH